MKALGKLLGVLGLLFTVSCAKNTSVAPSATQQLVGTWNITSDISTDSSSTGRTTTKYSGIIGDYFKFTSDGQFYEKEGPFVDTATFDVVEGQLHIIHKAKPGVNPLYPDFDSYFFLIMQPDSLKISREFPGLPNEARTEIIILSR